MQGAMFLRGLSAMSSKEPKRKGTEADVVVYMRNDLPKSIIITDIYVKRNLKWPLE